MRFLISSATVLALAILFTACNAIDSKINSQAQKPANTATPYPDNIRRVTIEELEQLMRDGKAFVVDVRGQDAYDLGHIPGSRMIPAGDIGNHLKELPRDKTIVTYCS